MDLPKITLSVSPHFLNKDNRAPERRDKDGVLSNRWAYGAFENRQMTSAEIIDHVTSGRALCVAAVLKNWRKHENFVSSQLMGVDFDHGPDVDQLIEDEFIQEYAFLVYRTPSSTLAAPRTRALFMLDAPISNRDTYQKLVRRLLVRFEHQDVDEACKDAARIFYGSTQEGYSAALMPLLPVTLLEALPPHPSEAGPVYTAPPVRVTAENGDRLHKYADTAVQRILDTLASTRSRRNEALNKAAFDVGRFVAASWSGVTQGEAETLLYNAAVANGYVAKDGEHQARASLASGLRSGMNNPHPGPQERIVSQATANAAAPVVAVTSPSNGSASVPAPPVQVPPAPPPVSWKSSDDSMAAYIRSLQVAADASAAPLLFPYKALAPSGGFCTIVPAGILIGVVGMSGGMKTSFIETITDAWRQLDHDILWWGPEWDWQRMGDRAVQRYGGALFADKLQHELYLTEKAQGFTTTNGRALSDNQIKASIKVAEQIASWPGKSHYIENMSVDIEELLMACDQKIADLKVAGRNIRVAVFDYVQLLNMRSVRTEMERITQVLGLIKGFCVDHKIIGVIASQVTKTSGSSAREGHDTLDAESGQFQRSDKFNLVLTLNPIFSQDKLITNKGVIRVAKNSIGKPFEQCVYIDPSKFLWLDKIAEKPDLENGFGDKVR
jgi:hypothetical protein